YQRYMSGFADVMNGTTDVTITINGVAVTVPGQKSLAKKGANSDITSLGGLTTALSISQGGTGAKNAADARTNLGLGSAATKDVGPNTGNVLGVGYFGFGTPGVNVLGSTESGFYGIDGSGTSWAPQAGSGIVCGYDLTRRQQIFTGISGNLFVRNLASAAMNTASSTIPWTQMQSVGTSDINFKHVNGDLDVADSLENICQMEFKRFYYLDDDEQTERRGVIAQQIEQIDKEYVHSAEGVGKMTLDLNPLMMDALAA
ncbi:tail fiber domain-containing protein, partial [Enterobacter kobei]|uniref:tail fiber domain-containing protein n=1 Tax=Enterobacter kobei TaxID=208224 RepID=UPI001F54BBF8